jgi:hypothetical protein
MGNLQSKIAELAEEFAAGVMAALRSAPLDELMGASTSTVPTRRGRPPLSVAVRTSDDDAPAPATKAVRSPKAKVSGRLARRSQEQIDQTIDLIVETLRDAPEGMRSEQLQNELELSKKEITGPITQAIAARKIKKTGQKRATTYFAAGVSTGKSAKVSKAAAPTAARKSAKKSAKKAAPSKVVKLKPKLAKKAPKVKETLRAAARTASKKSAAKPKKTVKRAPKSKAPEPTESTTDLGEAHTE